MNERISTLQNDYEVKMRKMSGIVPESWLLLKLFSFFFPFLLSFSF